MNVETLITETAVGEFIAFLFGMEVCAHIVSHAAVWPVDTLNLLLVNSWRTTCSRCWRSDVVLVSGQVDDIATLLKLL